MNKYETLYETDSRFKRYVDADMKSSGRTKEETLAVKVVQNVAQYYIDNPVREQVETVETMKSGGC